MVYCCFAHIIYNQPKWLGTRQSWELNQSATLELDQPFDGDNIYHGEYVNKPTTHEQRLGEGYIRVSVDPKKPCIFSIDLFILIYLAFAQVNGSAGSQIFQAYLQCRNKGTATLHVLGGSVTNQPGYLACTRLQEVSQEFAALDSICLLFHRTRAPTQLM